MLACWFPAGTTMKNSSSAPAALPRRLSLVQQTVTVLQQGIRTGLWTGHLPAERDLAQALQVGRKTLRAALKELETEDLVEVSVRSRRRILKPSSKRPRLAQRHTVGLLMSTPFQSLHTRRMILLHSLRESLTRAGFQSELHVSPRCFSAHPARALEELIASHPGTVWLIFGSREPMQRWFIENKVPCLIIGSCRAGMPLPSLDVDHRAACRHAGALLLRKGHRSLALALPLDAFDGDADSELGLRDSLQASPGLPLHLLRHDGSNAHLCRLLDAALASAQPPTAIIVARAIHAFTVTMHLLRRGLRIPQDIAVISRDDDPFFAATVPAVTRYSISIPDYVRRVSTAARQLAETGTLPPKTTRLVPDFVSGETA
jgi:DNA-binding LacI/PurR family transcriptional regulator